MYYTCEHPDKFLPEVNEALESFEGAMLSEQKSMDTSRLTEVAYDLYEKFRPDIPEGKKGWGAEGTLSIDEIRKMAE